MQLAEFLVQVLDVDRLGGDVAVDLRLTETTLIRLASGRLAPLAASRSALVITLSRSNPPSFKMDRAARLRQPCGVRGLRRKPANG